MNALSSFTACLQKNNMALGCSHLEKQSCMYIFISFIQDMAFLPGRRQEEGGVEWVREKEALPTHPACCNPSMGGTCLLPGNGMAWHVISLLPSMNMSWGGRQTDRSQFPYYPGDDGGSSSLHSTWPGRRHGLGGERGKKKRGLSISVVWKEEGRRRRLDLPLEKGHAHKKEASPPGSFPQAPSTPLPMLAETSHRQHGGTLPGR